MPLAVDLLAVVALAQLVIYSEVEAVVVLHSLYCGFLGEEEALVKLQVVIASDTVDCLVAILVASCLARLVLSLLLLLGSDLAHKVDNVHYKNSEQRGADREAINLDHDNVPVDFKTTLVIIDRRVDVYAEFHNQTQRHDHWNGEAYNCEEVVPFQVDVVGPVHFL